MTRTLHPSELARLLQYRFTTRILTVTLAMISALLLTGGSRSPIPEFKVWMFGCSLATAFLARKTHEISIDSERQFDDARDISLTNWQNQLFKRTRSEDLTLEVMPAEVPIERLPLFDWRNLSDSDEHPILAIVAPMGGGKSRLIKYLSKYVLFDTQPSIVAFDIYARQSDWEYAITDYAEMRVQMESDLASIHSRIERYRSGEVNFSPAVRVLEEAVDTLPHIRSLSKESKQIVDDWVRCHVSVARKVRYRLCLVSVKLSGADIGIGSESRDDATVIFVGQKGIAKAMSDTRFFKLGAKQNSELKQQLQISLNGIKHPALIYSSGEWIPAAVPSLNAAGDPVGTLPLPAIAELDDQDDDESDILEDIEALAIRLIAKGQRCTPGNVRRYLSACKADSDEVIIELFQELERTGRGTLDLSGKAVKFCPNPENSDS